MPATRAVVLALALGPALAADAGQSAPPDRDPPPAAVRLILADHPTLAIFDRAVRLELKGRFDADVLDLGDTGGSAGPDWSGRRIGVGLSIGRTLDADVSRELAGDRPWRDVHLTWRVRPWLYARGGRFKVPFSEERVRSLTDQDFLERSLAARTLAPGRDVGLLAGGRAAGRRVEWEAGVFEGRGEAWPGKTPLESTPATPLVAIRVGARPLAARREGRWRSLRAAVAVTRGDRAAGLGGLEAATVLDRARFTLPVFVAGPERRLGLETQFTPGRLRLRAEWMRLSQARLAQGLDGADLPTLRATGWHTSAVWQVFRRRGRDHSPTTDWLRSGEVAIRVEGLAFAAAAGADGPFAEVLPLPRHRAVTAGTTWTLHRWIVVQVDVVHERLVSAGIAALAGDRRTSVGARWRLAF